MKSIPASIDDYRYVQDLKKCWKAVYSQKKDLASLCVMYWKSSPLKADFMPLNEAITTVWNSREECFYSTDRIDTYIHPWEGILIYGAYRL